MQLVFASGFLIPQHPPGTEYFRGLKEHIARTSGHTTLFPPVPPLGNSEERAQALANAIAEAYPEGEIHIIAHSMGGLDGRVLIDRNHHGLADPGRIASLTTLSTPHRGSPVADLLAGPKPPDLRRVIYDAITDAIGRLGIDTGALANLTTEAASAAPDVIQTRPHIRYRSYFASGRLGLRPTCFLFALSHRYIENLTGQKNDGLVALESAKYGKFQEPTWPCDHADMIGHNLDILSPPAFAHLPAYDAIISRL